MFNVETIRLGSRDAQPQLHLALSEDAGVEQLLSNVPSFCVGVMAFAVFTFFLVTKRSNLLATYLYSSTLLCFIAAIFDLSYLLTYGASTKVIRANSPNGLEIAREVGLSLSVGFRMIFFWGLVDAEPARERPFSDNESLVSFRMSTYSSSWARLGVFGRLVKWLLLLLITSIPVLQIVWRLYRRMHNTGPLYLTESSLEIVVLTVFVLKILLNASLADSTPWRSSLAFYAAPLLALALSLSLAIGNIVIFCFSETTLGRFLQAISLYVLILWVLIIAFRPIKGIEVPRRERPRSSFQSRPERGPRPPDPFLPPLQLSGQTIFPGKRPSISSRLSSFVSRPPRRPSSPIEEKLWTPGQSVHPFATAEGRESGDDSSSKSITMESYVEGPSGGLRVTPEPSGWISSSSAVDMPPVSAPANLPKAVEDVRVPSPGPSKKAHSVAAKSFSLSAYYEPESPLPSPTRRTNADRDGSESPIYSLYGILPGKSQSQLVPPPSPLRPVSSRLSAMLREQRERDRTVSKLLSPQDSPYGPSSFNAKKDSFSAMSEFSLSNFPVPPNMNLESPKSPLGHSYKSRPFHSSFVEQVPTNVENTSDESLGVPRTRMDSHGTQYDVTSFIGAGIRGSSDEAYPRPRKEYDLSDIESVDGASQHPVEDDRQRASRESTAMLNLQTGAILSAYGATEPSRVPISPTQSPLRPLYLGQGSPDVLSVPRLGLPPRPQTKPRIPMKVRPTVSRPRDLILDPEPADAYESPRPPPLIYRTLNRPS